MTEVRTTCPYCGVGCGVIATTQTDGSITVEGDPEHPANYGRLCSKGSALAETLGMEGRLLAPKVNGAQTDWDTATKLVAEKASAAIAEHGPDSVAFYVSGQLLSEDYYVANKLMKGFIGSANIDTNSRLCMASSVAGHKRAFGTDTVPGTYEDLELADTVVLVGSNLAWCHPVLFQRILAAKKKRPEMRIVTIDPRNTATAQQSDLHLPIAPGGDVALFNGLLAEISARGALASNFVNANVDGISAALASAELCDTGVTGLAQSELDAFYDIWLASEKTVTVYSQGVNQSTSGTDKVNAIINCHLATGRIGRAGMGPFSVTGQPNAMGGREVGGLANMLACHMDIENAVHRRAVQKFWKSPTIAKQPGLKAVDLFKKVSEGQIKFLWIMCTNPAVSMPDADFVRSAIENCDFVVVSDIQETTDTTVLADVLLPAMGWGEKSGTLTNSERMISRQRPFMKAPREARPDWKIICDVATAMGFGEAFAYSDAAEIFEEYARMSSLSGDFGLDFDIRSKVGLSVEAYETLAPFRWPSVPRGPQKDRFFSDGVFFTANQRAQMVPISHRPPAQNVSQEYPFRLNTGRIRDQWHTMTRSGKSTRLSRHLAEPFLEIHPDDADRLGIAPAGLAEVKSEHGTTILRALVTDRVKPAEVFAPFHWSGEFASAGRVDALISSNVDRLSGQPEFKAEPVSVAPFRANWFGFAVSRAMPQPKTRYWAKARVSGGYSLELADTVTPEDWEAYARELFALPDVEVIVVSDRKRNSHRMGLMENGELVAVLFVGATPIEIARSHTLSEFANGAQPQNILAGRAPADMPDPGPTICSCFNVGANTLITAITESHLRTVEEVGAALQAGTNCGSCRVEIAAMIGATAAPISAKGTVRGDLVETG